MNNAFLRSCLVSLVFMLLLGAGLGASCLPEHVSCAVADSPAKTLASEGLIAFALALIVTLCFELMAKALDLRAAISDGAFAIALAAPILVPFCFGTGCRVGQGYWMLGAVAVAALGAATTRRLLIRASNKSAASE